MRAIFLFVLFALAPDESWWSVQSTGVDSNLRGITAVVHRGSAILWATGSKGTILRSADAGQTWTPVHIPGTENADFRGVQTFDGKMVYVFSIGDNGQSRIFKTSDSGANWETQFTDKRKSFFLDALVCSDATHCFALSDPIDGKFLLLTTTDGSHWKELPRDHMPAALPKEGVFAASNSSLLLYGKSELYFATGGPAARVFHSPDVGQAWTVTETPILSGKSSQGIFSIVRAGDTIVVAGGDYADANRREKTAAYSSDEGKTWHLAEDLPKGFRSSVDTFDAGFVAVGPNGAETSRDGIHWLPIDAPNLNALTFISGQGWAVGAKGTVAHFIDHTPYTTQ